MNGSKKVSDKTHCKKERQSGTLDTRCLGRTQRGCFRTGFVDTYYFTKPWGQAKFFVASLRDLILYFQNWCETGWPRLQASLARKTTYLWSAQELTQLHWAPHSHTQHGNWSAAPVSSISEVTWILCKLEVKPLERQDSEITYCPWVITNKRWIIFMQALRREKSKHSYLKIAWKLVVSISREMKIDPQLPPGKGGNWTWIYTCSHCYVNVWEKNAKEKTRQKNPATESPLDNRC